MCYDMSFSFKNVGNDDHLSTFNELCFSQVLG